MTRRLRTFVVVSSLGFAGALSFASALPRLVERLSPGRPMPLPWPALMAIMALQSGAFVALAAALFVGKGESLALDSPLARALAEGRRPTSATARAIAAGVLVGAVGGAGTALADPGLVGYLGAFPVATRLLYGGLTEEVLIRGGLLTLVALLFARLERAPRPPGARVLVPAIVVTDALFVLGHLPALHAAQASDPWRSLGIVFVATLPWGFLAWRLGLESAMAAHASFHAAFAAIVALGARV